MTLPNGSTIQIDNGEYTRIHNVILELLARTPLSGRQLRCLIFLLRKTYGYNRREDRISLSQWAKGTGIARQHVWAVLQKLLVAKIVYCRSHGPKRAMTWGFNKYHEQWQTSIGEESVPEFGNGEQPSVPADGNRIVTAEGYSSAPSVPMDGDKTVPESGNNKRQKTVAAAAPLVHGSPPVQDPFIAAYERFWGRPIGSPFESDQVADWSVRVTLAAWTYALKESAKMRATNWNYLGTILERVEREGYQDDDLPAQSQSSAGIVNYSLEELCLK